MSPTYDIPRGGILILNVIHFLGVQIKLYKPWVHLRDAVKAKSLTWGGKQGGGRSGKTRFGKTVEAVRTRVRSHLDRLVRMDALVRRQEIHSQTIRE